MSELLLLATLVALIVITSVIGISIIKNKDNINYKTLKQFIIIAIAMIVIGGCVIGLYIQTQNYAAELKEQQQRYEELESTIAQTIEQSIDAVAHSCYIDWFSINNNNTLDYNIKFESAPWIENGEGINCTSDIDAIEGLFYPFQ